MGNILLHINKLDEAIGFYYKALKIKHDYSEPHNNLGAALFLKGNVKESIVHFRKALQINPDNIDAQNNLLKAVEKK